MNRKELGEIRRRLRPEKSNIQHIYGCYVNGNREIISEFQESMGLLSKEEQEKYIGLLKKTLSGGLGRNLQDLRFSTKQVAEGDEHKLLSALRRTELKDEVLRRAFYQAVIEATTMEDSNYLILTAFDAYDVPHFNKNGDREEDSEELFRYILCCVCPVKSGKAVLSYSGEEERFRNTPLSQVVSAPEFGFMFPAFDNRSANIYDALFYSRNTGESYEEFIAAVFSTRVPMPAKAQKDSFRAVVQASLEQDCSLEAMQTIHGELSERIALHKESKDPEPLTVSMEEVEEILEKSGMKAEHKERFATACKEHFGDTRQLSPENLISPAKFEITTESAKIAVDPKVSALVQTRMIDGKKYLLIPADGVVEVNGVDIVL